MDNTAQRPDVSADHGFVEAEVNYIVDDGVPPVR